VDKGDSSDALRTADLPGAPAKVGKLLHASPAQPAANQGWSQGVSRQLKTNELPAN
jgi:hypothetical protein